MPKLLDRIFATVGLQRITGASSPDLFAMDKAGGIRIGQKYKDRSLNNPDQNSVNDESYRCWSANPLGKFVVDTYVNHIIGDCVEIKADNDETGELQKFFDDFKKKNDLDSLLPEMVRNFELFGEVLPVPLVNNLNGDTAIGFVDPSQIKEIKSNPVNWLEQTEVILSDPKARPLKIIKEQKASNAPIDPVNPRYASDVRYANADSKNMEGKLAGDVFYWSINRPIGASRGVGDLFSVIDMLNGIESLSWSAKTKIELQLNAVLEITFPNSWTQQKINKAFTKGDPDYINFPDEPGKPFGHTENVKMNWLSPNIGATELDIIFRILKSLAQAGVKIPEHLWGQGNETNFATAAAMNSPFYRTMKARQVHFKNCIRMLIQFALDHKLLFALPNDPIRKVTDFSFTVNLPEIDTEDEQTKATALQSKMTSLLVAKQGGGITDEQYFDACQKEIRDAGIDLMDASYNDIEKQVSEIVSPNDEPQPKEEDSAVA